MRFIAQRPDRQGGLPVHGGAAERAALRFGALQAGLDSLLNHGALNFREHATHLEQRLTGRRSGIDALLMQVQVYALRLNLSEEFHKVLQRTAEAIDGPCGYNVYLAARSGLKHLVKLRALVAALCAANGVVHILRLNP